MNKTKYNQLRKEIIKCCPRLNIPIVKITAEQLEEIAIDCGYFDFNKFIEDRPITLEDCLIAWKKYRTSKNPGFEFGIMADTYNLTELLDKWQFNIPLQDQSDECKELLWDLICNK